MQDPQEVRDPHKAKALRPKHPQVRIHAREV
jgi:hypothetical protein